MTIRLWLIIGNTNVELGLHPGCLEQGRVPRVAHGGVALALRCAAGARSPVYGLREGWHSARFSASFRMGRHALLAVKHETLHGRAQNPSHPIGTVFVARMAYFAGFQSSRLHPTVLLISSVQSRGISHCACDTMRHSDCLADPDSQVVGHVPVNAAQWVYRLLRVRSCGHLVPFPVYDRGAQTLSSTI